MKRKLLAAVLIFAMLFSLLPTAALAENSTAESTHSHCVCGGNTDIGDHTSHDDIEFKAWNKTNAMPTDAGNYVLMNDVTLSSAWYPVDGTVVCLNGNDLKVNDNTDSRVIYIESQKSLVLCDCSEEHGKITGGKDEDWGGGILIDINATLTMYNGQITGNSAGAGAGVYSSGIFNMYGGKIYGNTADSYGGGVYHDGNTAYRAMKLSGNATITDNFLNDGTDSNLHVGTRNGEIGKVTIADGFSGNVGISMYEYGVFSVDGKNNSKNFTADNSNYATATDNENLKLVEAEVHVGQAALKNGEYTTDGASKTTTAPTSGGYAHFEKGVLMLNNFDYSGGGYCHSAIYCNHALTIKIEGENNITRKVVAGEDTNSNIALRGIRVEDGKLTIIGDSIDDSLKVVVNGHDNVSASGIYGDAEGIDIYNCTLEARSVNGGKGLNAPGNITITGAKVIGASEAPATSLNNQGIYAGILKVTNSDVVGIADNTSPGRATGIFLDASKAKLIYESGTIIGEVPDALGNSYAIYIDTNAATLPAKYWMRSSASADFAEGTWDGASVGPYIELTTTEQHIHDWEINWTYNDKNHWYKCLNGGCSEIKDKADHKGGTATCTAQAVCDVCGAAYGLVVAHDYSVQQYNSRNHWNKCATCDETTVKEDHYYGNNNICDICGYERVAGGGGFTGDYNYPVIIDNTDGADVKASENYVIEGEKVTITVTPDAGKQVDEVLVTDEDGKVIPVTKTGDNQYSFTMPKGKVNVWVTTEDVDYDTKIVLQIGNKNVVVDNRTIVNDVAPTLVGDRTLVPLRVIIEALGGSVDWDEATRTVTIEIDGKVVTLIIDEEIPGFGQGAIIIDNRTYVPIRYIAEYVDAHVDWIAESQQVVILK